MRNILPILEQLIDYELWRMIEKTIGISYLEVIIKYVYSTADASEIDKLRNLLIEVSPAVKENVMTIAERYIERGKLEGKLEAAERLIAVGLDRSTILKTLELSEAELNSTHLEHI